MDATHVPHTINIAPAITVNVGISPKNKYPRITEKINSVYLKGDRFAADVARYAKNINNWSKFAPHPSKINKNSSCIVGVNHTDGTNIPEINIVYKPK